MALDTRLNTSRPFGRLANSILFVPTGPISCASGYTIGNVCT